MVPPPVEEPELSVGIELSDAQARYIGVAKEGPYKAEHYRY